MPVAVAAPRNSLVLSSAAGDGGIHQANEARDSGDPFNFANDPMLKHQEAPTRVRHAIRRKLEAGNLKGTFGKHGESHMAPPWLQESGLTPRLINLDATVHPI